MSYCVSAIRQASGASFELFIKILLSFSFEFSTKTKINKNQEFLFQNQVFFL